MSIVLDLPRLGPALLKALLDQDTRTAPTIMPLVGMLTVSSGSLPLIPMIVW